MDKIREDCIFYNKYKVECRALNCLYCRDGSGCVFFKEKEKYNPDGTEKKVGVLEAWT